MKLFSLLLLIGHAKLAEIGRSGMRAVKNYAEVHCCSDWEAFQKLCFPSETANAVVGPESPATVQPRCATPPEPKK